MPNSRTPTSSSAKSTTMATSTVVKTFQTRRSTLRLPRAAGAPDAGGCVACALGFGRYGRSGCPGRFGCSGRFGRPGRLQVFLIIMAIVLHSLLRFLSPAGALDSAPCVRLAAVRPCGRKRADGRGAYTPGRRGRIEPKAHASPHAGGRGRPFSLRKYAVLPSIFSQSSSLCRAACADAAPANVRKRLTTPDDGDKN